uniref:Portal protein n=1 Tax=candidate division CPR3 bacterium TaxID=2268181 RepID=A0A7V3N5V9_UNCC3
MPEPEKAKPIFDENKDLTDKEREDFNFVKKRIEQLKEARRDIYGINLEKIWAEADRDYIPHRLRTKGKRVIATDEEKGWRGTWTTLGEPGDWQSDIAQPNPYIKIQTALAILIDRNPTGVFLPGSKRYQATTNLMKQLYQRSWETAKSKQQLKLFVFNLAKYGWAIGRTYPLRIVRKIKNLIEYNQEKPEQSTWEEKEIVEYNDIFRENLDPWNAWIDDMAKPNNPFSLRDWCWRKVYPWDVAEEEFGKYKNWKYVQPGGIVTEKVIGPKGPEKKFKETKLVEVYFYENRIKDLFMVIANNVPIIIEPLSVSDAQGNKKLSCWQGYWNLRHAECPYGIGVYEAIRYDQAMLDRIRNMTLDQLTLSIYKMFFYRGTERLTETGEIEIKPGTGKQVLDPKNIQWLEVPPPGADAWNGIAMLKKDVDDVSGITEPLMGTITGKTAFEIAQAKEAALKRLKTPLDNICDALEQEAYITISLIQLIYSIPETYKIADPNLIDAYLKEIQSDPELYERDEEGNFVAKIYPEIPLNLEEDEKGNLTETAETRFFRIKPRFLKWEGIIHVDPQTILTPSKQLDKALELEMYNILIPLLTNPPELYSKVAKNIVKLYDKDPKDILPDSWLEEALPQPVLPQQAESMPFPIEGLLPPTQPETLQTTEAERLVPRTEIPVRPQSFAQRLVARLTRPFRKV